ncbi:MAG: DNA methylase [Candidatus Kapaibacterium sp.]|nr:MAG: DNA methylase [Candidatus Kapabacteria bacterium]
MDILSSVSDIADNQSNGETEKNAKAVDKRNKLNELTGSEWMPETKSFFYQKGLGAKHPDTKYEKMHPAPFSYTDIIRLIRFFTKTNDRVLDPFSGIGSTLKACLETERDGFGVELSEDWCALTRERLHQESAKSIDKHHLLCEDSRNLTTLFSKETFDFIVTSPPYWSILDKKDHKAKMRVEDGLETKYSNDTRDLGNIESYSDFLEELLNICFQCYDVLKKGKYFCLIVSDFRHKSHFIPFHSDLVQALSQNPKAERQFMLKGVKVLLQNAKKLFPYGYPFSYVENIHHQYILILQKP